MFCLADNIYFNQIKSITKNDMIEYYSFIDKIEYDNDWKYLTKQNITDITEAIYNLKIGIESELNLLFLSSYSNETMLCNQKIYKKIQFFEEKLKNLISSITIFDYKNEVINKEENIFLDNISKNICGNLGFVKNKKFQIIYQEFTDLLIISSLDETLGKVLVMFSNRNYPNLLSYELLDIIFSTLGLYFYSRRAMKYFLLGKNITRVNKIMNRFDCKPDNKNICPELGKNLKDNIEAMRRILDYLIDLIDSLKHYGLSLKNHKVLKRIAKNLYIHIAGFNQIAKNNNLENEFLLQFTKVFQIYYKLSDDFDLEELNRIKKQILYVFKKNDQNIFDKNHNRQKVKT